MQPNFNITRESNNILYFDTYSDDSCQLQFHSQIEIYFVDEGSMDMYVGGEFKTLYAGQFSIALSYEPHAYKTPKTSSSSVLLIPPYLCEEFISHIEGKKLNSHFITDQKVYNEVKGCFEHLSDPNISYVKTIGYINVILGIILENSQFTEGSAPTNTELATKILFYLHQNFKNDISPASVAKHFGYSNSYISRYFKSCFNITLIRYLNILRLKNAVMLMHGGKGDITNCAFESGFSSMRTFYRAFNNEFKMPPSEYIKSIEADAR